MKSTQSPTTTPTDTPVATSDISDLPAIASALASAGVPTFDDLTPAKQAAYNLILATNANGGQVCDAIDAIAFVMVSLYREVGGREGATAALRFAREIHDTADRALNLATGA
jgi:hypothetical protein